MVSKTGKIIDHRSLFRQKRVAHQKALKILSRNEGGHYSKEEYDQLYAELYALEERHSELVMDALIV